jgi:putative CocE/NonD family hydrolase
VKLGPADLYRPAGDAACPVLLIRTPYDKGRSEHEFVAGALERGYAVVVSDVRGRYSSEGDFDPYRHEGLDGYDSIEWVAAQPWSNGRVATAGLSYPGAVQWLAAVESPPHLVCAFPAMCFSSGRQFFYFGGAFDLSWLSWTVENIAAEDRRRRGVAIGPQTTREARQWWRDHGREALARVPLRDQPALAGIAPFYFDWLDHPDDGSVLALRRSGIEALAGCACRSSTSAAGTTKGYGPIGAVRNFTGLRDRAATPRCRDRRA